MQFEYDTGLRVAWRVSGGLGDALQAVPFMERWTKTFQPERLAFYKDAERIESVGRIVVDCLPGQEGPFREGDLEADIAAGLYDLRIDVQRAPKYTILNPQRVQRLRPALWKQIQIAQKRLQPLMFVFDHHAFYDGLFGRLMADYGITVVDSMFYFGGFSDAQADAPRIAIAQPTREKIRRFGLEPDRYITIHDGFDVFNALAGSGKRPTRAWPRAHWEKLIAQLKADRPDLQIVQIGAAESSEYLYGIDHYLLGATSLEEAIGLIDGAALHIDTEGGFVPCAWGLGTPAISIQGPTGSNFYHYDGVVQIFDSHCHGCWWSTPDWMENCPRGLERAECMYRVTPETVLGEALKLLSAPQARTVAKPKIWADTVWSARKALPPLDIAAGQLDSVFWRGRRAADERTRNTPARQILSVPPEGPQPVAPLLNRSQILRLMALDGEVFVTTAYRSILEREPDEGGLETYTVALTRGELTKAEILKALLGSDEARRVLAVPAKTQTDAVFTTTAARLLQARAGAFSALLASEAHGHALFIKAMSLKKDRASQLQFEQALQGSSRTRAALIAKPGATAQGGMRVAVFVAGSLGDMLQQAPFINTFSERFRPSTLDMYFYPHKQGPGKFTLQCISNASGPFDSETLDAACQAGKYDLRIDMKHLVKYHALAPERIRTLAPDLFEIIAAAEQRLRPYQFMLDQHPIFDGLFGRLMAKYGMNAVEATGFLGGLPMSRTDAPRLSSDTSSAETLSRFGLVPGQYIVLHDGFDVDHYMVGAGRRPTKNWPTPHWERLAQLIKAKHPHRDIVQIGHTASSETLRGVDIDLIGKTSLTELVTVLDHAALVVTSEGGILRLAWALDVPTVSLQGPSGSEFFHFGKVDTVISQACNGCWFVLDEWMARCYRGFKGPICMSGIRPETVVAGMQAILAAETIG